MIRKAYEVDHTIFITHSESVKTIDIHSGNECIRISRHFFDDFIQALDQAYADLKEAEKNNE
jgi:hypothetical protein